MRVNPDTIDNRFPFFPFKVKNSKTANQFLIKNHLMDEALSINGQAAEVLRLANGENTLKNIVQHLVDCYPDTNSYEDIRRKAISLYLRLTEKELIWWRDASLKPARVQPPPGIFWEITAACNLRCRHCVVSAGSKMAEELSTRRCLTLAEEMAHFGVKNIAFSGGEPFIHPDFQKIVEHVKALGLEVQVATNGTLIKDRQASWLNDIQAGVQVSLDGSTSEIHDHLRPGNMAFDSTIAGIKALVKTGLKITVGTVLSSVNKDDIGNIIRLAEKMGVANFRLIPFVPKGRGEHFAHLEVPPKEVKELTFKLKQLRKNTIINITDLEFEDMTGGNGCIDYSAENQSLGCSGAVDYGTITPSGELLPCHFFHGVRADRLVDKPFDVVWCRSRFLNYFRQLRVGDLHGACRRCESIQECRGGCRAVNFAKGDLFGPNLSCWIAQRVSEA